jgi:hypothetical protein
MAPPIGTEPVFEALRSPLGMVDDAERRQVLERYIEAARLPLERALFDLLAALAAAIDERVADHYRVRLAFRPTGPELEVEEKEPAEPLTPAEAEWTGADGEMEKITLRIPAELKQLVTQLAAEARLSVNSWFIRTLAAAVRGAMHGAERAERRRLREERRGRGARLSGWIGEP